ncbi:hypothetical protein BH23ACT5_BH23ACT5_03380 [soil metagenome]
MTAAVRRIALDDSEALREIRLRSLRTDPSAFGSSFSREVDRPDTDWRDWAVRASAGPRDSLFLAERGEAPVGLVGAFSPDPEPSTRHVIAMWVAPEVQRRGVGTPPDRVAIGPEPERQVKRPSATEETFHHRTGTRRSNRSTVITYTSPSGSTPNETTLPATPTSSV